ncbi:hypothetical protein ACFCWG_42120 [Streptomyces sp. NPDC056390]|uniref:hypothetical protein n=1 Tax=Streptomyces sp. NPDC056390 TaxID=3345806 RepID=UPI0035DD5001
MSRKRPKAAFFIPDRLRADALGAFGSDALPDPVPRAGERATYRSRRATRAPTTR